MADEDFVVKDGVLVKYAGAGGDAHIPDGVTAVGENAFHECWRLTAVHIPDSVKEIGEGAFSYCTRLTAVRIPDKVTVIEQFAFFGCCRLTGVHIPERVTAIGYCAFAECARLIALTVDANNERYSSSNGMLYDKARTTLLCCPGGLREARILDSVTTIEAGAFVKCENLITVYIPDRVTAIGEEAFWGCYALEEISVPAGAEIGAYAFQDCPGTPIYRKKPKSAKGAQEDI